MSQQLSEEVKMQLQALGDALANLNITFELSTQDEPLSEGIYVTIRADKELLQAVEDEIWKGMRKHHKLSFFPID